MAKSKPAAKKKAAMARKKGLKATYYPKKKGYGISVTKKK